MVLKYKVIKDSIKISSEDKTIPSNFKECFLKELIKGFDLYECKNKKIKKIDNDAIINSIKVSDKEIDEYKKFYDFNDISDVTFEEFLDSVKVNFSNVHVVNKGSEDNSNLVAVIDFEPDGDINAIWIDTFQKKQELIECIKKIVE